MNSYNLPAGSSPPHNNNNSNKKIEPNAKQSTLCQVCGDYPCGYNYGAYTCEACREFFRRWSNSQAQGISIPPCLNNNKCKDILYVGNRKNCQHCRFEKCKDAGMKKEAESDCGQPSNIRRAEMIQQRVLPSVSQQSSVGSAVAHSSNTPQSCTAHDAHLHSNQTSILSPNYNISSRLESPSGDSGSASRAYLSSVTSGQHLPNEGDENESLVDTLVPTDTPPTGRLVETSDGRYKPNLSSSMTQQQETEAQKPLDLSKKKDC